MVHLYALGTAAIQAGGVRVRPDSRRKFALLLYLAVERGKRASRALLCDLVFPDQPSARASHSLRELAYTLRRSGVRLDSDKHGLELCGDNVQADYAVFLDGGRADAPQLAAVAGGFLPEYSPEHSEAFAEWFWGFRATVTTELARACLRELSRARTDGDWQRAELAARACLGADPMNETATFGLVELLMMSGAKVKAVDRLDAYLTDIGGRPAELRIPAELLRRRIREQSPLDYMDRSPLPFVGRANEMLALDEQLRHARGGRASTMVIHGEPGIGKTRVADELANIAVLGGWATARAAAQPHDTHRPLGAFVDLIPQLQRMPGALGIAPESLHALACVTGASEPSPAVDPTNALSAEIQRSHIIGGITDLVDAVTAERPVVLLIDDLQWIDDASIELLAGLASGRRERRMAVVATSRDAAAADAFARASEHGLSLALGALGADPCAELADSLIERCRASVDAEYRSWMLEICGGNAFFLKCLVEHFALSGAKYTVPRSVNELLDHWLASIDSDSAMVLATCAQLGKYATLERVGRVLEFPYGRMYTALLALEAAKLVVQRGGLLTPSHWLVSEAAKRRVTPIAARLSHARIAEILEQEAVGETASAERAQALLWDCAEHWLAADRTERAVERLKDCADQALALGRPREAAELLIRAAVASSGERRISYGLQAIQLASACGEIDLVPQAEDLIGETAIVEAGLPFVIQASFARAFHRFSEAALERLIQIASDEASSHSLRASAGARAMLLAAQFNDSLSAKRVVEALEMVVADPAMRGVLDALTCQLVYHASFGELDRVVGIAHQLGAIANEQPAAESVNAYRRAANAMWKTGDSKAALKFAQMGLARAEKAGLRHGQYACAMLLTGIAEALGTSEESMRWLAAAGAFLSKTDNIGLRVHWMTVSLEFALLRGDASATEQHANDVREIVATKLPAEAARLGKIAEAAASLYRAGSTEAGIGLASELTEHHERGSESSDLADIEVGIAAWLYLRASERRAARRVIQDYLRLYRRDRAPFRGILKSMMVELNIRRDHTIQTIEHNSSAQ